MPKLELFRHDEVGATYFAVTHLNGAVNKSRSVYASYLGYALRAYYMTMQDLETLESAKNIFPSGNQTLSATGMWFLCTEAYINTMLKLQCLREGIDFQELKDKSISVRLNVLAQKLIFRWKNLVAQVLQRRCTSFPFTAMKSFMTAHLEKN